MGSILEARRAGRKPAPSATAANAVASGSAGRTRVGAMVVATPSLLMGAIELLKARSSQTSVYVEEGDLTRLLPRRKHLRRA